MTDTVVYGPVGPPFSNWSYSGFVAGSGTGTDPPPDHDVINYWLEPGQTAHFVVTGISTAGSAPAQFVWVAGPGGTHLTTFGDLDTGSGDQFCTDAFSPPYYGDAGYFQFYIGSRSDLTYTVNVTITGGDGTGTGIVSDYVLDAPVTADQDTEFDFTVSAVDPHGDVCTTYDGTATFTASDPLATLPVDSALTSGVGTFPATLHALGNRTLTATDTVDSAITADGPVFVEAPPGPLHEGWWGLTESGNMFWASRTSLSFRANKYTWDGDLVATIYLPYPARHAWTLGGAVIPPLRQRQRDDVALPIGGRVALGTGNISTSRQASIRQGTRNTYF